MRVFREANFKFLSARRHAYVVSAAILGVGLIGLVARGGLQAGVEFTGGAMVEVTFAEVVETATLRAALTGAGMEGVQIQQLRGGGEGSEVLLRIPMEEGDETQARAAVGGALGATWAESDFEVVRSDALSSKVGSDFQRRAVLAVLISFVLTLFYLAFRFEWRFGVAAVIATVHDILITFGFIAVAGIEMTLSTVAALLTIVGYSLNDTIVVFDRVRENLRKKRREEYRETLDRSINETLPRTVLTSGTTMLALLSLAVLGGAVIRPLALVLIAGVMVGTYSSIFVAAPALLEIHDRARRAAARAAAHSAG